MKIGDRVKLSAAGIKALIHPETQDRLGTVTSARGLTYIGVLRDGSKTPERYAKVFWEVTQNCACMETLAKNTVHRNNNPCYRTPQPQEG